MSIPVRYCVMLCASALAAGAAPANPVHVSGGALTPQLIDVGYRQELSSLRATTIARQRADGGVLSAAHRAELQQRLDRINAYHARRLANHNPLTVDADGHPTGVSPATDWTASRLILVGAN